MTAPLAPAYGAHRFTPTEQPGGDAQRGGPATRAGPLAGEAAHLPCRPQWTCRSCGADWPCAQAQRDIAAELGRTLGCIYLSSHLEDAMSDLPDAPAALYARFLHPARTPQPATALTA